MLLIVDMIKDENGDLFSQETVPLKVMVEEDTLKVTLSKI
jgi:hypothetical protein